MGRSDIIRNISNNLRRYRQENKLTQEELAERAGISTPFYANIERGSKGMSIQVLVDLAKALGISVDCLINEENALGHANNISTLLSTLPQSSVLMIEKMIRLYVEEQSKESD